MSDDYIFLVLLQYDQKLAAGTLSLLLSNPSPANLRAVSMAVCEERAVKNYEVTLDAYFGGLGEKKNYTELIGDTDLDKFKPLQNFILRKTAAPNPRVVELLAWLIDFEHRPFRFEKRAMLADLKAAATEPAPTGKLAESSSGEQEPIAGGIAAASQGAAAPKEQPVQDPAGKTAPPPITPPLHLSGVKQPAGRGRKFWPWIMGAAALLLAGIIIYQAIEKPVASAAGKQGLISRVSGCMIWSGDHYRETACNFADQDIPVVPLDSWQLEHVRLISRPDTLTIHSVGKAGYFQTRDSIQFFTATGTYPLDTNRRLKPVTIHILKKYGRLK